MLQNEKQWLATAIQASFDAGKEILEVYNSDFAVEHKDDNSPLTLADKKAHAAIVRLLDATGVPVLSEEGKNIPYSQRGGWQQLWVVDPLDGTKEFIKRNGDFTVNIALVNNGVPVLGVIFVPVLSQLYFASPAVGAYRCDNATQVAGKSLDQIISASVRLPQQTNRTKFAVVGSRSHMTPETEQYIADVKAKHGDIDFVSKGSSLKLCMVAEGSADVYPRFAPTMEWDTAAGQAIATHAGCKVLIANTDQPVQYNKENLLNPWFLVTR